MRQAEKWYAWLLGLVGLALFVSSFPLRLATAQLEFVLLLAACAALFAHYRVETPDGNDLALSTVFMILVYAHSGVGMAMLVTLAMVLAEPWERFAYVTKPFSFGQKAVALFVLHLTVAGLRHGAVDAPDFDLALLLGSLLYFSILLVGQSVMNGLAAGRSPVETGAELVESSYIGILFSLAVLQPLNYVLQRGGWLAILLVAASMLRFRRLVSLYEAQRRVNVDTLRKLSDVLAKKTGAAENHANQVANLARRIAETIGLPEAEVQTIYSAGVLHDIGEAEVDSRVVSVMARHAIATLADAEAYKAHATAGAKLVSSMEGMGPVAELVRHHHERWDGSGYPDGLEGDATPIGARILAAAEFVESLPEQELRIRLLRLTEASGTVIEPGLVPAVRQALAKSEQPGTTGGQAAAGEEVAVLKDKLAQAVRSSQVLEALGVSRLLSYDQGRFRNNRGEVTVVPARDQVVALAERALSDQEPVYDVITAGSIAFYVYCIPARDHSCNVLMFDVSQALSIEREQTKKIFAAYRDVIAAATRGSVILLDQPDRDALLQEGEFWQELPLTVLSDFATARALMDKLVAELGLPGTEAFRLKVSMSEAITNVFKHAGKGALSVRIGPNFVRVIVTDHGAGIPWDILPKAILTDGYSTQHSLGKGFTVMLKYLDHLYLATSGDGTTLILEKAIVREPVPIEPEGRRQELEHYAH